MCVCVCVCVCVSVSIDNNRTIFFEISVLFFKRLRAVDITAGYVNSEPVEDDHDPTWEDVEEDDDEL